MLRNTFKVKSFSKVSWAKIVIYAIFLLKNYHIQIVFEEYKRNLGVDMS